MRRNLYLAAAGLAAITGSTAANALATCSSLGLTFGNITPGPTLTAPVDCTFSETLTGTGLTTAQTFFAVSSPSSLTVSSLSFTSIFDGAGLFSPSDSPFSNLLPGASATDSGGSNSFTYSTLTGPSGPVYALAVSGLAGETIAGTFDLKAVPLPASAWLLLGALGGMGLLARRRVAT